MIRLKFVSFFNSSIGLVSVQDRIRIRIGIKIDSQIRVLLDVVQLYCICKEQCTVIILHWWSGIPCVLFLRIWIDTVLPR
jgi:hypothetical protein